MKKIKTIEKPKQGKVVSSKEFEPKEKEFKPIKKKKKFIPKSFENFYKKDS